MKKQLIELIMKNLDDKKLVEPLLEALYTLGGEDKARRPHGIQESLSNHPEGGWIVL